MKKAILSATIFNQVTTDMRIYKEEVFGPVLAIMHVDTLEQAIELINAIDLVTALDL